MTDNKNSRQIIIVYDFSSTSENALLHSILLCQCLKTNLTLVFPKCKNISSIEYNNFKVNLKEKIFKIEQTTGLRVQAFAPNKPLSTFYKALYQKVEAIMYVIGFNNENFSTGLKLSSVLRMIHKSHIPWLLVPSNASIVDYKNIVLPLSYTREEKEKIAWASYFYRLNKSTIHVLVPTAHDKYLQKGINVNLQFLHKLFDSIDTKFNQHLLSISFYDVNEYAVSFAHQNNYAPVMIMISKQNDIFDFLFGIKERPIIYNEFNIPTLCLSSHMPMYIICS